MAPSRSPLLALRRLSGSVCPCRWPDSWPRCACDLCALTKPARKQHQGVRALEPFKSSDPLVLFSRTCSGFLTRQCSATRGCRRSLWSRAHIATASHAEVPAGLHFAAARRALCDSNVQSAVRTKRHRAAGRQRVCAVRTRTAFLRRCRRIRHRDQLGEASVGSMRSSDRTSSVAGRSGHVSRQQTIRSHAAGLRPASRN